jgi:YaiO family outer membrane protein
VQRPPLAVAALWVAIASTTPTSRSGRAGAQAAPAPRQAVPTRSIAADYAYSYFQGDIDAWHAASISLADERQHGTIVGRVNVARRYAANGLQVEADASPSLGKAIRAYLNIGYSRSTIFPEWRSGAEVFRELPHAYELSAGYRQLRFVGPPVTLFTGAVSRSGAGYFLSARPYLRNAPAGLTAAGSLTARRYFVDRDNYIGTRLWYGRSPNEDIFLSQLSRLRSTSVTLDASHSTSPAAISTWLLRFEREELATDRFRNRWELGGGIRFRY